MIRNDKGQCYPLPDEYFEKKIKTSLSSQQYNSLWLEYNTC